MHDLTVAHEDDPDDDQALSASGESTARDDVASEFEGPGKGLTEPWLWTPPDEQPADPPIVAKLADLPLGDLSWENTERLFLQLLKSQGSILWAKLFGTRGQDQEGIDAYARLRAAPRAMAANPGDAPGPDDRPYVVLQSRRVRALTPSKIARAVDDFLAGTWPAKTGTFYYATTYDLTDTKLDKALRDASARLADVGIEFVPWGAHDVNEMLRSRPDLVDEFFGRAWVEYFCGPDAAESLRNRLEFGDAQNLRHELATLYEAVFNSQNAIRRPAGRDTAAHDFIILDAAQRHDAAGGEVAWLESGRTYASINEVRSRAAAAAQTAPSGDNVSSNTDTHNVWTSALGGVRRTLRPVSRLLTEEPVSADEDAFREPADVWLSRSSRNLIVGDPGSGKSSLLRFVARDLLSTSPQSPALQREHGGRLPIWLPFGFLSRHLAELATNSLTSAIQTWLASHSMPHLWPLVERAMKDDRLLLLIDGIDEWQSQTAANDAIGAIEIFLGRTAAAAFLSSRPYAVSRISTTINWQRADLAPLDDQQRKRMAGQYLAPPDAGAVPREAPASVLEGERTRATLWHRANVEPFIAELTRVPELSLLTRTPLFLALLSTSWQGEPLPPRRYELYEAIVDLLIVRHPQMRRRSSKVGDGPLSPRDFRVLMEAVAYTMRVDGNTDSIPIQQMRKRIQAALADDEVLGYPAAEARLKADAALAMAEDEYGLLVSQGAEQVGFVHRVVLDHLAGRHLARQPAQTQAAVLATRHPDPAWRDVLLSTLTAQPNPPAVADLLDSVLTASRTDDEWPTSLHVQQSAWELLAEALAAEVALLPRKAVEYTRSLIEQVESSPFLEHRANLITTLVTACATTSHKQRLLPIFRRWVTATRPYPEPALFALRDLPIPDSRARRILVHCLRNASAEVRANAAAAYAHRFGHPRKPVAVVTIRTADGDAQPPARRPDSGEGQKPLIELIRQGPNVGAQAAGLLALALGWPDTPETQEHLEWGRRQCSTTIRTTALFLTVESNPDAPIRELFSIDEVAWIMEHLRDERRSADHSWPAMMHELVERVVAEAEPTERLNIADFALKTLQKEGVPGGNRSMAWGLACGPLAEDHRLRDWVVSELTSADEHALILYNLTLIPETWREHPAMVEALASYVQREISQDMQGEAVPLAGALPPAQFRDVLVKGLDAFRPWSAADQLIKNFGEDEQVLRELRERLADDAKAARLSSFALKVLGLEAGFARIFSLLASSHEDNSELRGQAQVVLADAVAAAWRTIRSTAAGQAGEKAATDDVVADGDSRSAVGSDVTADEIDQARRVLASYSEEDVCAACTRVSTTGLGWHIPEIIRTWPAQTVDYAIKALHNDRHVTEGIADTIHAAVLRAHADAPTPESERVLDVALDLMLFLEPALREVLAHELCRSTLTPPELLDVVGAWKTDKDDGVRRTVAVGLTLQLVRHQALAEAAGTTVELPELTQWRHSVRADLCSYGRALDANRQNAWISMLLLGDLTLIDDLQETIGDPTPPGVRLTNIHGDPDDLLVTLIAQNWPKLRAHFGDELLRRLSGSRVEPAAFPSRAVDALTSVAEDFPEVLLAARKMQGVADHQTGYEAEPGTARATDVPDDPGLPLAVIDAHKRHSGGHRSSLDLVLRAADDAQKALMHRNERVDRWVIDHLLDRDSWTVDAEELRAALAEGHAEYEWADSRAWTSPSRYLRRAAFALHFPQDPQTRRWYNGLAEWFSTRRGTGPIQWLEVGALCLGAAPADDLPALVGRVFHPTRVELLGDHLWELTIPLVHRLQHDDAAVSILQESLAGAPISEASPIFGPESRDGQATAAVNPLDKIGRRTVVIALALKAAGHFGPASFEAAAQTLRKADQRLVVVNPFTNDAGPLWSIGEGLLPAQR